MSVGFALPLSGRSPVGRQSSSEEGMRDEFRVGESSRQEGTTLLREATLGVVHDVSPPSQARDVELLARPVHGVEHRWSVFEGSTHLVSEGPRHPDSRQFDFHRGIDSGYLDSPNAQELQGAQRFTREAFEDLQRLRARHLKDEDVPHTDFYV